MSENVKCDWMLCNLYKMRGLAHTFTTTPYFSGGSMELVRSYDGEENNAYISICALCGVHLGALNGTPLFRIFYISLTFPTCCLIWSWFVV